MAVWANRRIKERFYGPISQVKSKLAAEARKKEQRGCLKFKILDVIRGFMGWRCASHSLRRHSSGCSGVLPKYHFLGHLDAGHVHGISGSLHALGRGHSLSVDSFEIIAFAEGRTPISYLFGRNAISERPLLVYSTPWKCEKYRRLLDSSIIACRPTPNSPSGKLAEIKINLVGAFVLNIRLGLDTLDILLIILRGRM